MSERHLFLLSPYRPPTSYPVSLSPEEAAAWLNAHAALWHPAVLLGASLPPRPASAYDHNDPVSGCVYALACGPSLFLPEDWKTRAATAGAIVFDATHDRDETYANLQSLPPSLEGGAGEGGSKTTPSPNPSLKGGGWNRDIVCAFAGLGYGYLMIDTMFDAANHDRLLDAEGFWRDVQDAAVAAKEQRDDEAWLKLKDAAAKLQAAREGLTYNGVSIVEILIGNVKPRAYAKERPLTLVAYADELASIVDDALKAAVPGAVDLAIGAISNRDDALLPIESQLESLRLARIETHKHFGIAPKLYARRHAQYHASLPSWLSVAGYTGAVLLNLDGVTLPSRYSSIIQWPGPDGKSVNAYTRDPLPGHEAGTFFNLAYHLHEATSRDSQPTFAVYHDRNPAAGYADFIALAELGNVFGEFVGLETLLSDSHSADYVSVSSPDDFFIDTLDDSVTKREVTDPVSRFARAVRDQGEQEAANAFAALHRLLTSLPSREGLGEGPAAANDGIQVLASSGPSPSPSLEGRGVKAKDAAQLLAERLLARSAPNTPGYLILNPSGSVRRVALEFNNALVIPSDGPVKASEPGKAVVEVPGLGYAWIPRGSNTPPLKPKLKTADGTTVRNEFLEAELDPATGAIKAIRDGRMRVTRFGQLLVWRPGGRMVAKSVSVTHAGATLGEVTSRGEILDDSGAVVSTFTQRVRAWVGRPALEIQIDLHPRHIQGYPWHDYLGCRFAWRDDRAQLYRGSEGFFSLTTSQNPNSIDGVEIRYGKERSFIFTGGLPFLKRDGGRMLDVVLACQGETATRFDLLVAFDRDYPMPTASTWTQDVAVIETDKGPPPSGESGWLMNFDLPSLLLTSLRPAEPSEGMNRAIEARVIETAGYAFNTEFRFAKDPTKATKVDLHGDAMMPLTITGDATSLDGSANELCTVKFEWAA